PDIAQRFACGEQAGADSADWHIEDASELGVRVAFHFAQPEQCAVVGRQAVEGVGEDGVGFGGGAREAIFGQWIGGALPAPPLGGLLARDAVEPGAKSAAIGIESVWAPPDMGVGFLHEIVCRGFAAGEVAQKGTQARSRFAIPRFKRVGVACGDLLPEFPVVEQVRLRCVVRNCGTKGSKRKDDFYMGSAMLKGWSFAKELTAGPSPSRGSGSG